MNKLEFALVILASFEIYAAAYYLMGRLSKNRVAKLVVSLAALTSSILIIRTLLERFPIPATYRTWCGVLVSLSVALAIFAWIFLWVEGDLEGEGLWHKTSLLAAGIGIFSALSFIVSLIFLLAMTSRIFAIAGVVIAFLVGSVLLTRKRHFRRRPREVGRGSGGTGSFRSGFLQGSASYYLMAVVSTLIAVSFFLRGPSGPTSLAVRMSSISALAYVIFALILVLLALRRTYYRLEYRKTDETIYYSSLLVSLSRVALVRVALLIFIAVPVFLISTEIGRFWVSTALVVYISLEVAVIDFQLRGVHRAVHLLSRLLPSR